MKADQIGVDEMASKGKAIISITGREKGQAYYAGMKAITSPVLLHDSKIQHLALSGRDDVTVRNVDLGGDSHLTTQRMRVTMEKNGPTTLAEHVGYMKLSGSNVDTNHLTGILYDAITINRSHLTKTGQALFEKSSFQEQELGEDGRKREEKEHSKDGVVEVTPVMEGEVYQEVRT